MMPLLLLLSALVDLQRLARNGVRFASVLLLLQQQLMMMILLMKVMLLLLLLMVVVLVVITAVGLQQLTVVERLGEVAAHGADHRVRYGVLGVVLLLVLLVGKLLRLAVQRRAALIRWHTLQIDGRHPRRDRTGDGAVFRGKKEAGSTRTAAVAAV